MRRGIPKESNKQIHLWRNIRKRRAPKQPPCGAKVPATLFSPAAKRVAHFKEHPAANRDTASTGVARMRDFAHGVCAGATAQHLQCDLIEPYWAFANRCLVQARAVGLHNVVVVVERFRPPPPPHTHTHKSPLPTSPFCMCEHDPMLPGFDNAWTLLPGRMWLRAIAPGFLWMLVFLTFVTHFKGGPTT